MEVKFQGEKKNKMTDILIEYIVLAPLIFF